MKKDNTNQTQKVSPGSQAANPDPGIGHDYHKGTSPADFRHSYDNLKYRLVKEADTATNYDRFLSLAYGIRDRLVENWVSTQRIYRAQKVKRVYYFSLEFLIGRTLGNSILNLKVEHNLAKAIMSWALI